MAAPIWTLLGHVYVGDVWGTWFPDSHKIDKMDSQIGF